MLNQAKSILLGVILVFLCFPIQAKKPQVSTMQVLSQKIKSSGILNCFSVRQLEILSNYTYIAALILFIVDHERSGSPLMVKDTLHKALIYAGGGLITREILGCFITHDSKNSIQYLANQHEVPMVAPVPVQSVQIVQPAPQLPVEEAQALLPIADPVIEVEVVEQQVPMIEETPAAVTEEQQNAVDQNWDMNRSVEEVKVEAEISPEEVPA